MVLPFLRDVYLVKMYFSSASVIAFGLVLMSLMVDSTGEFVMIRSLQTNNKSKKWNLTCMIENYDGALLWIRNPSNFRTDNISALIDDQKCRKKCNYSDMNPSIPSIKWDVPSEPDSWQYRNNMKNQPNDKLKNFIQNGYLQTADKESSLNFHVEITKGNSCMGVIFSLCPECRFDIEINDQLNHNRTIVSEKNSYNDKDFAWQFKKIPITARKDGKNIQIHMIAGLSNQSSGSKPVWRFHSIRPCLPRAQKINATTEYKSNLPCQKLYENGSIVINSNTVANNTSNSLKEFTKWIRPFCGFKSSTLCKGRSFCRSIDNSTSCTCAPGFQGKDCETVHHTVGNFRAKNSESGIVELKWNAWIDWRESKWFCLKIELLTSMISNNQSQQTPFCKFYEVKKEEIEYSGTVVLETAKDYNFDISLLESPNDKLDSLRYNSPPETVHPAKGNDLTYYRGKNSIDLQWPSTVKNTGKPIVRILVCGFLDCPQKHPSLPGTKTEWEAKINEDEFTMCKSLVIDNISGCKLLPNESYVVKVLISDPVKKNSTLFVIDIEAFSPSYWIWITVSFVLISCIISVAYMSYRILGRPPHLYGPEILCRDSGANPEKLVAFENSVKKDAEDGVLEQQFKLLPKGLVRPCEYGRLPENKYKNRYANLIAYDDTRVMLVKNPGDPYSDYINANYIQGYSKKNAYIATQGPLPDTVIDFWRMVWQEEVRVICMLVDLVEGRKVMCEVYWPEVGTRVEYGNFVISNVAEHKFADYTCRTFVVSTRSGMEQRQVDHLQYKGWTDQEIPMYSHSLLEYLKKLRSIAPGPGPIVVHCCAGVERTGCIILCDICLHYIIAEGTVNVRAEAESIYNARANMLRNYLQYTLAHLVPIQFRRTLPTTVPCRDLSQEKIQELKNDLPVHMSWLTSSAWMYEALRPFEPLRPTHPENVLKNRFQKFMPVGPYLVKLPRYPEYDTTSDYISAVSVDGVKMKKQYLASQLPMRSTQTDFWRMIVEENVELIVILHNPHPKDDTCCTIFSSKKTLIPYPYVKVETKETLESNEYFTTSILLVTNSSQVPTTTRYISAVTCKTWRYDLVTTPPPPEVLLKLWSASEKMRRTSTPTLVLCYDGFTACGLYIAMSFILQRISLDQECDVIAAVQAVRRSRSDFVQFQWQFEYLYDVVVKYMDFQKILSPLTSATR